MGLLNNFTLNAQYPVLLTGATSVASATGLMPSQLGLLAGGVLPAFFGGVNAKSSVPVGYGVGDSILPPLKPGGMGARNTAVSGSGAVAATAAGGLRGQASLTGSGAISTAVGSLIAGMVAALTGSGSVTAAIRAVLAAQASLTGSGQVSDAAIGAIAGMVADLVGSGDMTAAPRAKGFMAAALTVTGSGLSTANVADAVWGALATANNSAGSMGQKLNSAASGGVDYEALADAVWAHADAGDLGAAVAIIEKILRNKSITDPATGEFVLFDDNGTTELFRIPLWEDASATQSYRGQGAERRERLA